MGIFAFTLIIEIFLFQGVFSKSIQNITHYEMKIDALEKSMEVMETRLNNFTEIVNRK